MDKTRMEVKEIAKEMRRRIKKEIPDIKVSIRSHVYRMSQELDIAIMESNFKMINREKKEIIYRDRIYHISEDKFKYTQLNSYTFFETNPEYHKYFNGVVFTPRGWETIKKLVEMANEYNYDNSDIMIDYFDVNYYLQLSLGRWDKPFKENI